ncbi:pentatricopeptide repeat-containing protein At4g33990 [Nymphaea colorata]|nr:pentatricopeptide repeat-containing protein At4g33990 [Nymphaea colorata]XP_031473637.1 pentatricopeptide repeat-containing protein At4g33990 [Nymphaea colorata]XP_031473638.1 pentatricopeptide repeat-containing protein At4g33990 [Nymphaea colorata]XP_031473639.1 pentatricopeptide repeat-containing protein At4g33990 [Nymphaea colorata]XP_031473641.1 pentatricopeptide repeat-containing protein At4g33990 [Nymphaea colorata]XP_031473642.1 pentatricopeptide repeat-containing protein At4g33990 [
MFKHVVWFRLLLPQCLQAQSCATFACTAFTNANIAKSGNFGSLAQLCTTARLVKQLHAVLVISGHSKDVLWSTKLVNLYANNGELSFSRLTFRNMHKKNVFSWNSIISACVKNGFFLEAMEIFSEMLLEAVRPDRFTFPVLLKAAAALLLLRKGRSIHCWVAKLGVDSDVYVASSLINLYGKCGAAWDAHKVFDKMFYRDVGSWNSMISGFCQNGLASEAVVVFEQMIIRNKPLDSITVASILPAIAPLGYLVKGRLIHVYVIKHGLDFDTFVSNALIDMYAKSGCILDARRVFDELRTKDLVSWNAVIAAYEQEGDPVSAIQFLYEMKATSFSPDMLTMVSLASICAQLGDGRFGRSVHNYVVRKEYGCLTFVSNAIVDMYAKLGMVANASRVFDNMNTKDVISWNSLITGNTQNGLSNEAIALYHKMQEEGIQFDQGTLVSILPACSHLGAVREGTCIHCHSIKMGLHSDLFVTTCLIDMYAKCGKLEESLHLFEEVPKRSSVPWNAIICGLGIHGHGEKSLDLFEEMQKQEVEPDQVTFVSLLSSCSHAGLVDQGKKFFNLMYCEYGIVPNLRHYACMVDLLGRSGKLDLAHDFITKMPIKPDASVWGALLGACRIHGNLELGKVASAHVFELDPENVGYYVLMSNMYATERRWEGVNNLRSLAIDMGLRKTPGWSSIEVNNNVHVFYTGNRSHPQIEGIYAEMASLLGKIKSIGYTPDFSCVLQDVEEDEKEHILSSHSERLAIVFGLIQTKAQTSLHIFKNLRVCGDCHSATKFISTVTQREIIVRDSNRFHCFKEGTCSCGDYW